MRAIGFMLAVAMVAGPATAAPRSFFVRNRAGAIVAVHNFGTAPDAPTTKDYSGAGYVTQVTTLEDDITPTGFTIMARDGSKMVQNFDLDGAGMSRAQQATFGRWLLKHLGRAVRVSGSKIGNAQIAVPDEVRELN